MAVKTPGVYLRDVTSPRTLDPQIETAVPGFVGYTEVARDSEGRSLLLVPTRIRNLSDFERLFGGAFQPETYQVWLNTQGEVSVAGCTIPEAYYLYDSLRHYFDNLGGDCYIVSIGAFADGIMPPAVIPPPADPCELPPLEEDTPEAGTPFVSELVRFTRGIDALGEYDEPTLVLFPDAVRMKKPDGSPDYVMNGQLQAYALEQCARLGDRFLIADVIPADTLEETASLFRDKVGSNALDYGAAYFPWLQTPYIYGFHFREIHFFDAKTLSPIQDEAILSSAADGAAAAFHRQLVSAAAAANEQVAFVLATLESLGINRASAENLDRLLLDQWIQAKISFQTPGPSQAFNRLIVIWQALALNFPRLQPASRGNLRATLERAKTEYNVPLSIQSLIQVLKSEAARFHSGVATETDAASAFSGLASTIWLANQTLDALTAAPITADADLIAAVEKGLSGIDWNRNLAAAFQALLRTATSEEASVETQLFTRHPLLSQVAVAIQKTRATLPPSGAIAGITVATDAATGVWKAPANVTVQSCLGPAWRIDERDQETLNVHESGKSLNAIRSFPGRGAVVWGARTLLSNSLEWRYVPVRRLFIYAEEYLGKTAQSFVFEPNDANTWLRIRFILEQFLQNLWRKGALSGNSATDAYYVEIGLGTTMTAQDILEGKLIVEIGMAVSRPAEFILIRYEAHMEES